VHYYFFPNRENDAILLYNICCMDKEYLTGFRGIDYSRTKSVAEGDTCCDYRLRDARKKKP